MRQLKLFIEHPHVLSGCCWVTKCCCCISFVTPKTVACQASLSVGSPRQEYWSGLPFLGAGSQIPNWVWLLTQELNLGLPHCRQTLYHLSYQGSYMWLSVFLSFSDFCLLFKL